MDKANEIISLAISSGELTDLRSLVPVCRITRSSFFSKSGLTRTEFFLLHRIISSAAKYKVVAIDLSKFDHRPLIGYIYYETILLWGLVSI